jgi:hypothetical protein
MDVNLQHAASIGQARKLADLRMLPDSAIS